MRVLWLLAIACSACTDVARVQVPSDVVAAGALVLDNGALADSTPLVPFRENDALPLLADGARETLLVAYTRAALGYDLAAIDPPPEAKIELAGCRAATLPAPSFAARLAPSGAMIALSEEEKNALPPLRAYAPCPAFTAEDVAVDLRCSNLICDVRAVKGEGCELSLDLSACAGVGGESPRARVDANGHVAVNWSCSALFCAPAVVERPPASAYDCADRGCQVDLYFEPGGLQPPFTAEELELFPPPHRALPSPLNVQFVGYPEHLGRGYVLDAIIAGDALLVSATRTDYDECADNTEGEWPPPGELFRVPIDALQAESIAALPPCAEHLVLGEDESSFFTAFEADGVWHLGRFALSGAMTASVTPAFDGLPLGAEAVHVGDLELRDASSGRELVMVVDFSPGAEMSVEALLRFRLPSLEALPPFLLERGLDAKVAVRGEMGDLIVTYARTQSAEIFDPSGARSRISFSEEAGVFAGEPYAIPGARTIAFPVAGSLFLYELGVGSMERIAFTGHGFLLSERTWPSDGDGNTLVTGGSIMPGEEPRAVLRFYDRAFERFLPGAFDLGYGVAGRLLVDRADRLWVTRPFDARISRLTSARR